MKTFVASSIAGLSSIFFGLANAAETLEPGSPAAAASLAAEFIAALYSVPQQEVDVDPPDVAGEWANVHAQEHGKSCDLKMHREAGANPKGWVVTLHSCK